MGGQRTRRIGEKRKEQDGRGDDEEEGGARWRWDEDVEKEWRSGFRMNEGLVEEWKKSSKGDRWRGRRGKWWRVR